MDYKKILDNLPLIIFVKSASDSLHPIFYNKEWYRYTGVTEEFVKEGWLSVIDPQDVPRARNEITEAVQKGVPYETEVRLYNIETGTFRWCLSRACPITEEGKILLWVGTLIDIHDRKISVEQLQEEYSQKIETRKERIKQLEDELEMHKTSGGKQ